MSGSRETTSRSRSAHGTAGACSEARSSSASVSARSSRRCGCTALAPSSSSRPFLAVAIGSSHSTSCSTDPLGLARVEQQVDESASVLIRPRIPTLTSIFSAHGARDAGAARSRLRRPTGFEIHAVRDYAPGEPLRAVHWPSTARRGRLMVKELDDAPRDDLAIVLDQDPDGVAGPVGQSSFDAAVRAAGALALAHVLWNRRVVLVGTAAETEDVRIRARGPRLGAGAGRARDGRAGRGRTGRPRPAVAVRGDHAGTRDRRRHGTARPGGRAAARAPPRRPLRLARDHGLRDLCRPDRATHSSRPRCAQRRRACWWPSSPPRPRSPRLWPGAAQERPVASVIGGFGRRLLAASVPVTAVAYAWASLESAPSVRLFAAVVALAVPAALPSRPAVRVVVALVTLGGLTLVAAGRSVGAIREVVDQGLRDIYAVAPPFVPKTHSELHALVILTACAFCLVDRDHRRQQAVPRRCGRRRRDRVARHDPAGPEHDRDGGAGAARRALADRDRRPARPARDRSRRSGRPGHRARRRGAGRCRRATVRGRPRLAELGPVRREQGRAHRRGRVALRLRRHRLPAREDHGAQDQGAPPGPVLARDHARHVRLGSLGRDALPDRRRHRPTVRCHGIPCSLPPRLSRERLGEAGGGRARPRRRPRHRREPADGDRREP